MWQSLCACSAQVAEFELVADSAWYPTVTYWAQTIDVGSIFAAMPFLDFNLFLHCASQLKDDILQLQPQHSFHGRWHVGNDEDNGEY
jgi:hypothetical protein